MEAVYPSLPSKKETLTNDIVTLMSRKNDMSFDEFRNINDNAERVANKIYKICALETPSIPAMIRWIEQTFGFKIFIRSVDYLPASCAGIVYFDKSAGGYQIKLNENDLLRRQRFTLCHEIAHIIRNMSMVYGFSTGDIHSAKGLERFCDRFAAAFLMPSDIFIRKWRSLSNKDLLTKARIAEFFDVSIEAVSYRVLDLNISNHF